MDAEKWTQLDATFKKELREQSETHDNPDAKAHIDACLTRMNTCLQKAIEVEVPIKK